MPPRATKRQHYQDEYTEESDEDLYKRRKVDKKEEEMTKEDFEKSEEYLKALEVLNNQKENGLLLIQTELRMRLESANNLALFEEKRINQFFEEQKKEVKEKLIEEKKAEQDHLSDEKLKYRKLNSSIQDISVSSYLSKKDHCVYTTQLKENEMVSDLIYMIGNTRQSNLQDLSLVPAIAIPLSNNRLLLNDHIILPETPCTLIMGNSKTTNCVFLSTIIKENKDSEFVVRVSATRKRRFPISSLCDGKVRILLNEKDLHGIDVLEKEE